MSRNATVWALLLTLALLVGPAWTTVAQFREREITGTVVDDAKKPLIGATVVIDGKKGIRHY